MDMRLGIEPLHVIERRHIEKAVSVCDSIPNAALLLEIGRATLYRKLAEWSGGKVSKEIRRLQAKRAKMQWKVAAAHRALEKRKLVEQQIERQGGVVCDAAAVMGVPHTQIHYSLGVWRADNQRRLYTRGKAEGISDDEIEVLLRRRSVEEHAARNGFSQRHAYDMLDEACALVGLRRYRHWLFLA